MSETPQVSDAPAGAEQVVKDQEVTEKVHSVAEAEQPEQNEGEATTESYIQEDVDAELEEMKRRLAQMEAESAVAKEGPSDSAQDQPDGANGVSDGGKQGDVATANGSAANAAAAAGRGNGPPHIPGQLAQTPDSVADADARSVYVGNVDYSATGDQLSAHFQDCGTINRVTIMCNKATGQPKGYAYIEFQDYNAAQNALILNDSMFLGRPLKIVAKRTNIPAIYRGGYGRGRGRYTRGGRGYVRRPRRMRGRWAPY